MLRDVRACKESVKRVRKFHSIVEEQKSVTDNFKMSYDYNHESFKRDLNQKKKQLKVSEITLQKELTILKKDVKENLALILGELSNSTGQEYYN